MKIHITLIMVLIRTENTRYTTNSSFEETINKFQRCNIKKNNIRTLKRKKKKLQNNKDSILFHQTCLNTYKYTCIHIDRHLVNFPDSSNLPNKWNYEINIAM